MQNNIDLIRYKWECGVYTLEEIVTLVYRNIITEDQFFDITRFNFNGVVNKN